MHPHMETLNHYCLQDLKVLHQWLGEYVSHFVVLGDGHLYFYRVFGRDGRYDVSQDARVSVYDHTETIYHDGLELFYIHPKFRSLSN